jgi:hypothetical protein
MPECRTRNMTGGSWRANLAKGGTFTPKSGSSGGGRSGKKLGKSWLLYPPREGWSGGANPVSFKGPQNCIYDKMGSPNGICA